MFRTVRIAVVASVAAAAFAPLGSAAITPPVFVHSAGANAGAYLRALHSEPQPVRHLSRAQVTSATFITDNSPSQNRISRLNVQKTSRVLYATSDTYPQ